MSGSGSHPARVIVADPPWSFGDALPPTTKKKGRGAAANYPCLSLERIKAFALPPLASPAVLFLWRVSAMQEEALSVARAWGFVPKTEIVWIKRSRKGGRHFGMGHYVRAEHESCIVAVRGSAGKLVKRRNIRSTFEATTGRHSEKPAEFYALVEALFDGPYAELFSRRWRAGWDVYGNEM